MTKDLKTIFAVVFMTYIVDLDAYELHPRDEKYSTNLLMNARVLHYTYDGGLFKNISGYLS